MWISGLYGDGFPQDIAHELIWMTELFIYEHVCASVCTFCVTFFLCVFNVIDTYVSLIMMQADVGNLVAQIKDLERKNAESEEQNKKLISKVTPSIVCEPIKWKEGGLKISCSWFFFFFFTFSFKLRKLKMMFYKSDWVIWCAKYLSCFSLSLFLSWLIKLWSIYGESSAKECHFF